MFTFTLMRYTAHLIVIYSTVDNQILRVEIWSSPEWQQSLCPKDRTFVAYEVTRETYKRAKDLLLLTISQPTCRYHYLWQIYQEGRE